MKSVIDSFIKKTVSTCLFIDNIYLFRGYHFLVCFIRGMNCSDRSENKNSEIWIFLL